MFIFNRKIVFSDDINKIWDAAIWNVVTCVIMRDKRFRKNLMFKLLPAGGVLFTQAGFLIFYGAKWNLWLCVKFSVNLDVPDSDLGLQSLPLFSCCIKVSQEGNVKSLKNSEDFINYQYFLFIYSNEKSSLKLTIIKWIRLTASVLAPFENPSIFEKF